MPNAPDSAPRARVVAVRESLVTIEVAHGPLVKNEVGYVVLGEHRLKAETLRVRGRTAEMQVFEDTRGVTVGTPVELTGEMLSVTLGPGLLGQVFDGLQNPLDVVAQRGGFFLPRGLDVPPLDPDKRWTFAPTVPLGATVQAGQTLGTVQERSFVHKVMAPFDLTGSAEVTWIRPGSFPVGEVVARLRTAHGEREVRMAQSWPVRRPLPERMLRQRIVERLYPSELLPSTVRIIDTFFPIARGGTACIPGPFGAGKTVLQNLIARHADVDVVVIVACGERAGEVVETITEFPATRDPRGGGTLLDRTIIVCNTSSMPVAARESSIYTGVTLGEYYRQMGYDVLVIADSTSRWAQAMRETSGRLEEIPGEEAYPAYLDSTIKGLYERAGVLRTSDGAVGSLTLIGTVSPAGGNFEEPVTQSTLGTVKTFLGLSSERAYRRAYPAIDPLLSWSRYHDQLRDWCAERLGAGWTDRVHGLLDLLQRGDAVHQMMQVTGEEGISLEDYVTWQKATLVDLVYLQQDAFDPVDVSTPLERQRESLELLCSLVDAEVPFPSREAVRDHYTRLAALYRNLNYSASGSAEHRRYRDELEGAGRITQRHPADAHSRPGEE